MPHPHVKLDKTEIFYKKYYELPEMVMSMYMYNLINRKIINTFYVGY